MGLFSALKPHENVLSTQSEGSEHDWVISIASKPVKSVDWLIWNEGKIRSAKEGIAQQADFENSTSNELCEYKFN